MFIIEISYTAELSVIDEYLAEHRDYLEMHYTTGQLLCSGPKNPRNGGIVIGLFKTRDEVDHFILNDPFNKQQAAKYTVSEFIPVKCHTLIKELCS
jgi:uncharacterized protein YciI